MVVVAVAVLTVLMQPGLALASKPSPPQSVLQPWQLLRQRSRMRLHDLSFAPRRTAAAQDVQRGSVVAVAVLLGLQVDLAVIETRALVVVVVVVDDRVPAIVVAEAVEIPVGDLEVQPSESD